MAEQASYINPRKRKRRRRQDKPAINARLVLDDHVKGDIGILSEDLFKDLFPNLDQGHLYSVVTYAYSN
jgi:peroxin-6